MRGSASKVLIAIDNPDESTVAGPADVGPTAMATMNDTRTASRNVGRGGMGIEEWEGSAHNPSGSRDARRRASDPRHPLSVANAGSGKRTHVLVKRGIRLNARDVPPEKKSLHHLHQTAAANMAERVSPRSVTG